MLRTSIIPFSTINTPIENRLIPQYNKGFQNVINSVNNVNTILLDSSIIHDMVNEFWSETVENTNLNIYSILVLFKVKFEDGDYMTIGHMNTITKNTSLFELISIILEAVNVLSEHYKNRKISNSIYTYKILDSGLIYESPEPISSNTETLTDKLFTKYNFPENMEYDSWGDTLINKKNISVIEDSKKDITYTIKKYKDYNEVEVIVKSNKKYIFRDYPWNSFKRVFEYNNNQHVYYYKEDKLVLKIIDKKVNVLTPIKKEKKEIFNVITLDIETRVENGVHIPYCICFYDGKNSYSYYITEYENSVDLMINTVIESLLKPKYSGFKVYSHNLSGFDGIFLYKYLMNFKSDNLTCKFDELLKDNKMIYLKMNYSPVTNQRNNKFNITFHDSLLMLPHSLESLANKFNVKIKKGVFPYNFLNNQYNTEIDLNYIGGLPDYKYYSGLINQEKYELIKNEFTLWNLKQESIDYCLNDCKVLYEVLKVFNKFFFNLFKLNIQNYSTLPSLAFDTQRSNFFMSDRIPLIVGQLFDDIHKSFTGGSCDVYIPQSEPGKIVRSYDFNSIYPSEMRQYMPVAFEKRLSNGSKYHYIKQFEGDISLLDKNPYGVFEVIVNCPDNIMEPILQRHFKINGQTRTIAPTGTWKDWYYSEELKNAEKVGYTYTILRGYLFDKEIVFKDYVEALYKIKASYSSDHPMYQIAKLLLNSLFGRYGMNQNIYANKRKIISDDDFLSYKNKFKILNIEIINDLTKELYIEYEDLAFIENMNMNSGFNSTKDPKISVPIASAITANARIQLAWFKNNPLFNLFYCDTDCAHIDIDLSTIRPDLIGPELGQLKLENEFKEVVYLAPKVYGGINLDNKEVVKVKGYKNIISFNELKDLLNEDSTLELKQEKWYRDKDKSCISIKDELYTLTATQNKRKLIYENGQLTGTKPYKIYYEELVDQD